MSNLCQSCGTPNVNWLEKYPELNIKQCQQCKSLSYFPQEHIAAESIYTADYFHGQEYENYTAHRLVHEANFKEKWELIKKIHPSPLKVYEIGCAYGYFTAHALAHGAQQVFGVDISAEAVKSAQQEFGPYFGGAEEFPSFAYNCLVAWDLWEHLPAPYTKFRALIEQLEPNGLVALTTVDSSSLVAKLRGKRWRQIHPPSHIHYPTKQAIRQALESLGMQVIYHSTFAQKRALETYLKVLGLDALIWPASLRQKPLGLNLFDIQLIIARKLQS